MTDPTKDQANDPIFCSFCGKNRREVRALVAGRGVFICSECLELAVDVLAAELRIPAVDVYAHIRADREDAHRKWLARMAEAVSTSEVVEIGNGSVPASVRE